MNDFTWSDLKWWNSGERQAVEERLDDLIEANRPISPSKSKLYAALDEVPFDDVKVCIIGQDPYPDPIHATGVAFSIPSHIKKFPQTLSTIFDEYESDLHYPRPTSGDLTPWCAEGVLLLNAVPSCESFRSLSHNDWPEWKYYTSEIVKLLSGKGIVFVLSGTVAKNYSNQIEGDLNSLVNVSHPSPRASKHSREPFRGSRIFTRVNDLLVHEHSLEPIDWRL